MPPRGMNLPTVADAVKRHARRNPDAPMLVGMVRHMSYSESAARIGAFSAYLRDECGVKEGTTVIVSALNCMEMPLVIVAATAAGARMVLFSPEMTLALFRQHMSAAAPAAVILTSQEQCLAAREVVPDAHIFSIGCDVDPFDRVERIMDGHAAGFAGVEWESASDAQIAVLSSGTTGKPKTIVNTASSFVYNGLRFGRSLGMDVGEPVYLPVPVYHVFGIVGLFGTLLAGATSVSSPKYSPEIALALIQKTRATIHLGVPTMFVRELDFADHAECDLSSLRCGLVAGAGCPPMVIEEFERRWGCRIQQSYGMSETAATLTLTPLEMPVSRRVKTAGCAIEGVTLAIDAETGEILVKTPAYMLGIERPDGTLDPCLDGDGWYRTGDIGSIDADGMLTVTGRIKEMIIRGGINIFPAEIEALYMEAPGVRECCLVSYPDIELGERTCLCVVPEPGASIDPAVLREWSRPHLEKFKVPDTVVEVESLPLLPSGKVDRGGLEDAVHEGIKSGRIHAYGRPYFA